MVYKFTGETAIVLRGFGKIEPGDIIETEEEINHPDFEETSKSEKKRVDEVKKGKS